MRREQLNFNLPHTKLVNLSNKNVKMIVNLRRGHSLLFVLVVVAPRVFSGVIHSIQTRSIEQGQESGVALDDFTGASQVAQNVWSTQQGPRFQPFLPFWWFYLRPMLNVFAGDTNFRQVLQKEFEYKLEHGDGVEQELFNIETGDTVGTFQGGEIETVGNEFELNEHSDDVGVNTELKGLSNEEHSEQINMFGNTETELGEQNTEPFTEVENLSENGQEFEGFGVDETGRMFSSEIENFGMEPNGEEPFTSDVQEQEPWQFGLTGNIVDAFSNSAMGLMPVFNEPGESNSEAAESGESLSETLVPDLGEGSSSFGDDNSAFSIGTGFESVRDSSMDLGQSEDGEHQTSDDVGHSVDI